MVESCTSASADVNLGPLYKKEAKSSIHKVTFADKVTSYNFNIARSNLYAETMGEEMNEKCVDDIVKEILSQLKRPYNLLLQHYVDDLFLSILQSLSSNTMCHFIILQVKLESYADKVVEDVLSESFGELLPAIRKHKKQKELESYANSLVKDCMATVVKICDNGLLEYAENCSSVIANSSAEAAHIYLVKEKVACVYAEKLSLRVFRDFFIHIITDANRIAYHLLGSYEAVSKNQIRTFADNMTQQIMREVIPYQHDDTAVYEPTLIEYYSENLASDILLSVSDELYQDTSPKPPEKSTISVETAEYYASQIMQNFFWDASFNSVATNKKISSAHTSSTSSLLTAHRMDSYDEAGESVTPKSATEESQWKRGLYHFADQLLFSLAALENDDSFHSSCLIPDSDQEVPRVKRSGSCPHIRRKSILSKRDSACNRRLSETVVRFRSSVINYAEDLAATILNSVVSRNCVFLEH